MPTILSLSEDELALLRDALRCLLSRVAVDFSDPPTVEELDQAIELRDAIEGLLCRIEPKLYRGRA